MKRVMGWCCVILGLLLAVYPVGWMFETLGSDLQEEAGAPLDMTAMVVSVLIGGGLVWGGWSLLRTAGASMAAVKRLLGWCCVILGLLPAVYPPAFVLELLIARIQGDGWSPRQHVSVGAQRAARWWTDFAGWSLLRSARRSKTEPPPRVDIT